MARGDGRPAAPLQRGPRGRRDVALLQRQRAADLLGVVRRDGAVERAERRQSQRARAEKRENAESAAWS